MKTSKQLALIAIVLLLLPGALLPSSGASDGEGKTVAVLFDFGDGRWVWTDVPLPDPANAWCATVEAASIWGFLLEYSFSQYGVFLEGVDGVFTPIDFSKYWGLWSWGGNDRVWESSTKGALDLEVNIGASVAWRFGAFGEPGPDANPVTRDPWLSFRGGKDVQGVSASPRIPAGADFWNKDMHNGPIDSTLAVADGKVFGISGGIFDWNLFEFTQLPAVFALDIKTSALEWSYEFKGSGGFEIGSPAYHNGMVFATLSNRSVIALDADTGDLIWQTEVDDEGLSSSPTVAAGRVITGTGSGKLVALNAGDGSVNWSTNISGWVYLAQPTVHDGIVYIGTDNGSLHAISLEDGTELWSSELGGRLRGTPLVQDGSIYLIKGIYDSFIPKEGFLLALDMDGNQRWEVDIGTTGSSPAFVDGKVVVGSSRGLYAFDTSGTLMWSYHDAGAVSASPAIAGDTIYIMNNENVSQDKLHTSVIAIRPNGTVEWTNVLDPHNWALSSVAIADGRIFVATDAGWVYCLGDTFFEASYEHTAEGGHVSMHDTSGAMGARLENWTWHTIGVPEMYGRDVEITFNASGNYSVTLWVMDEFGRQRSVTNVVTVQLPPLVAGFTYELDGMMATFIANQTTSGPGIDAYIWTIEGVEGSLVGEQVTHEFKKGGKYDVSLILLDEYDRHETYSMTIEVDEESTADGIFSTGTWVLLFIIVVVLLVLVMVLLPTPGKEDK